ncbi:nuclear transport factor 2 family protein [Streptomyces sp. NPDC056660]|uniref:nuclear transport factor 2 family protein n=1 Tax=Streptomyces sp. NPDC056660 TaxID=3345897 RepID=UPI0036BDA396
MGAAEETSVRRLLNLLESSDPAERKREIAELFTEDAVYEMHVPAPAPFRGRAAIVGELSRQSGQYRDLKAEIRSLVAAGRHVITERSDSFLVPHTGDRVTNEVCAVFELDDSGLIRNWREYWDVLALTRAMGVPVPPQQEA